MFYAHAQKNGKHRSLESEVWRSKFVVRIDQMRERRGVGVMGEQEDYFVNELMDDPNRIQLTTTKHSIDGRKYLSRSNQAEYGIRSEQIF